jgi:hypothetical protein
MTYAEFLARPASVNDAECLTVVMGWHLEIDGDYTVWMDADGNKMADLYELSPTTDRNATAMLVLRVMDNVKTIDRFLELLRLHHIISPITALAAAIRAAKEEAHE